MVAELEQQTERGFSAVIHTPAFLRMWISQAVSQTAQNIINLALLVTVDHISASSTAVSGIVVAFALPGVLFSTIAGVLVDRSNKRTVMRVVHLVRAVVTVGFIFATHLPIGFALAGIYALGFGFATVTQFFGPAEGAAIPVIVRKSDLAQANALFTLTITVSQLIGFATLGPILIALLGLDTLYIAVAVAFVLCAVVIWWLPSMEATPRPAAAARRSPLQELWHEIREAWVYIYRDKLLLKAMGFLTFASSAFLAVGTLAPKFATTTLQLGESGLGYILAPAGIGMVAGVVFVGRRATEANREVMIQGGALSQGVFLFLFATLPGLIYHFFGRPTSGPQIAVVLAIMLCSFLLGVGQAFIVVPCQTVLQERSGAENRARVLSSFFTLSNASALVPTLTAGLIGDTVGVGAGLLALAVAALALGGWSIVSYRRGGANRHFPPNGI